MVKLSTYEKVLLFDFTMKEREYPQIDYSDCETQPFCGYNNPTCKATSSNQGLIQREMISVGNMFTFIVNEATKEFDKGKVLQFAYYKEENKKAKEYSAQYASKASDNIGVLCT